MSDINITVNDEIVNIDIVDEPVLVNVVNSPGVPGAPGQGVPVGGTTGQVLKKLSNTNYDTYWAVDAGGISSIGLTMPAAFNVANSPLTANGTLAVTGAGSTTQYIDGTGALQTFPLTLPVLQEVRNQTGATLDAGTVVYINGATGNKPTVTKAIATGDATSAQTLGMVSAAIANNGTGYVVVIGTCSGLDTSAFTEGQQLYLSYTTAGAVTTTKPYAPNHLVYVGIVTRAHPTLGTVEVRVQNGYELDEIHDVDALNPNNNDGIFYNSTTSLWEHKQISTALGYTPANSATTLTINGVTYDLSANRTFSVGSVTGSGSSGQVAYWTGASAQSGSNNLFWDAVNNRLGIGITTPAVNLDILSTGNVSAKLKTSTNTGVAYYLVANDVNSLFEFGMWGSTRTGYGVISSNTGYIYGGVDLNITSETNIRFGVGTAIPDRMRIFGSTGNVGINTGATDGGQRLQVQGTTLLNGNVTFSSATGMFWDATNSRLGIGTNAPTAKFQVNNSVVGDSLRVNGASNTSLVFNTDSGGRATINVYGNTSATVDGGAYFNAFGYQESWFLVAANQASAGNKNWRFGNLGQSNYFAIQKLNDALNAISSTPFVIHSSSSNISIGSTFTADSGERLQVTGDVKIVGSGAGSATTALRVQNSSSTNLLFVRNDGRVGINTNNPEVTFDVRGVDAGIFLFRNAPEEAFINIKTGTTASSTGVELRGLANQKGFRFCDSTNANNNYMQLWSSGNLTLETNTRASYSDVASALLQVNSTTKGFLPPRMTTTQKNAISSPAAGLVVYDTTLAKLCVYTTAWETITSI